MKELPHESIKAKNFFNEILHLYIFVELETLARLGQCVKLMYIAYTVRLT